ncbi:MAG: RraA family protein [Hyphomicrobiaceae bacterium]|nr:RraA family protein [Hyphomicrobiaceae bacterium]
MLEDPPLLVVRKSFKRPPAEKLAGLAGAQTGHVVDAMNGRGALDAAIKPVDPGRAQFVGIAMTCETGPSDNLAITAAIALARKGDVIVSASDGFMSTAVVGDIVTMMARNAGVAALVLDGMARDSEGIVGVGLPVFSRGITPNSGVKTGPGRVGLPVVAGGVAVEPGDVIVGDRDGVVVVPQRLLDEVIERVAAIREAEKKVIASVSGDKLTHMESIAALLKSDRVRYVD